MKEFFHRVPSKSYFQTYPILYYCWLYYILNLVTFQTLTWNMMSCKSGNVDEISLDGSYKWTRWKFEARNRLGRRNDRGISLTIRQGSWFHARSGVILRLKTFSINHAACDCGAKCNSDRLTVFNFRDFLPFLEFHFSNARVLET